MPKYRFHVVGIRHHDYANNLDELYERAEGKSMTMYIEEENLMEENAVRVYLASKFVGYVRTGAERMLAVELLRDGRLSVMGKVVEIDREYRMITIEVDTDVVSECKGRERGRKLRNWKYYGEKLLLTDEEITLKAMLNNLQMSLEQQEEWNDNMTQYMDFIEQNFWRDVSRESQHQLVVIEQLLTANSDVMLKYKEAAQRVAYILTDVNSPEARQRLVDLMKEQAKSKQVAFMIKDTDDANKKVNKIPYTLRRLYDNNPQEYVGRLRYMRCPYSQIRQLQTLMVMRIALCSKNEYMVDDTYNILVEKEGMLDKLTIAINRYFNESPKNMALIYCVLRDLNLLVNAGDYIGFVNMLNNKGVLRWMKDKEVRSLANSMGQYMRNRKDHNKLREGYGSDHRTWDDDSKEKMLCDKIAELFAEFV